MTKQGGTETETESRARVGVGVGFAEASAVAFNGALHLAPYLHVLPADLLAFKPLLAKPGVRERFEADDYVTLLRRLRRDAGTDQPLSERRLDVALWVLGSVADARRASRAGKHSDDDWGDAHDPLPVPDERGVLADASALRFNDAPWIQPPDGTLCATRSSRGPPRWRRGWRRCERRCCTKPPKTSG